MADRRPSSAGNSRPSSPEGVGDRPRSDTASRTELGGVKDAVATAAAAAGTAGQPLGGIAPSPSKKPRSIDTPWGLLKFVEGPQFPDDPYKGTTAEYAVRSLLGEFKEHTKKKLEEITAYSMAEAFLLSDVFDPNTDMVFHNIVFSMGELSKHYLNVFVKAIINWRAHQLAAPPTRGKGEEVKTGTQKISRQEGLFLEERVQLTIDYIFCVTLLELFKNLKRVNLDDALCAQLETLAFQHFRPSERPRSNPSDSKTLNANREKIPDLYARILGKLSKYRFVQITDQFFKEVGNMSSSSARAKGVAVLQGIRYLHMKISSRRTMDPRLRFLAKFYELFKQQKSKRFSRKALSETFVGLLKPLLPKSVELIANSAGPSSTSSSPTSPSPLAGSLSGATGASAAGLMAAGSSGDFSEWFKLLEECYVDTQKSVRRAKDIIIAYPILTVLLCLGRKEFFHENAWDFISTLIGKFKEKALRPLLLESLFMLIDAYLTKFADGADPETVNKNLNMITSALFPTGGKRMPLAPAPAEGISDSLKIYVDIVTVIASKKLDYAMTKVVFELLRADSQMPERQLVGLRSFLAILDLIYKGTTPSVFRRTPSSSSSSTSTSTSSSTTASGITVGSATAGTAATAANGAAVPVGVAVGVLEPYIQNMSALLSNIFQQFGDVVSHVGTWSRSAKANLPELLRVGGDGKAAIPAGAVGLDLLRTALACIPHALPSKLSPVELVLMLAQYSIYPDKEVSDRASHTLTRLMSLYPHLRPHIVLGLGEFVLGLHEHIRGDTVIELLKRMSELLRQWAAIQQRWAAMKSTANRTAANRALHLEPGEVEKPNLELKFDTDASRIEAVALVYLCSPAARARLLALRILKDVRTVAASFAPEESDPPSTPLSASSGAIELGPGNVAAVPRVSTRVMDVFDENGTEAIQRLNQEFNFRVESFERIIEIDEREAQKAWTVCLAELLKPTLELCSEAVRVAWNIIASRLHHVKIEDTKPLGRDAEETVMLWRNYIAFACATAPAEPYRDGFSDIIRQRLDGPGTPAGAVPTTAHELFIQLIPLMKSELHRDHVVQALQRTSYMVHEVLFEDLKPVEQEYIRKGKKRDRLRNDVGLIYTYTASTLRQGALAEHAALRENYIRWIHETAKYLAQPSNEFFADALLQLRFSFCTVVGCVAQNLAQAPDHPPLDKDLRRSLFNFLTTRWTRTDAMMVEEQWTRALNTTVKEVQRNPEKKNTHDRIMRDAVLLQYATCSTIASLLLGPAFDDNCLRPDGPVFNFINNTLLHHSQKRFRQIGRTALDAFLQGNAYVPWLLSTVVDKCYDDANPHVAKAYFLALVELYKHNRDLPMPLATIFNLILHKAGDRSPLVRRNAIQLLHLVTAAQSPGAVAAAVGSGIVGATYPLAIESKIVYTFQRCQYLLSEQLAKDYGKLAYDVFSEIVLRLQAAPPHYQKQLLMYSVPWIKEMNFRDGPAGTAGGADSAKLDETIINLLLITQHYAEQFPHEVERIWTTVADEDENIGPIIDFLLTAGAKKRNPEFVPLVKKIVVFLGRTSAQVTVDTLVTELSSLSNTFADYKRRRAEHEYGAAAARQSTAATPAQPQSTAGALTATGGVGGVAVSTAAGPQMAGSSPSLSTTGHHEVSMSTPAIDPVSVGATSASLIVSNIDSEYHNPVSGVSMPTGPAQSGPPSVLSTLLPDSPQYHPPARGYLALMLLTELSFEIEEAFVEHLPVILYQVFVGFDSLNTYVHEHCRVLLSNLVHSLVMARLEPTTANQEEESEPYRRAVELADLLRAKKGKQLFVREDITLTRVDIASARELAVMVERVRAALAMHDSMLHEKWAAEALSWAISCPLHHIAGRSYQIFRSLKPTITREALISILEHLWTRLKDPTPEKLGVVMEIVLTLQAMVDAMEPAKVWLFPQIFWAGVALLLADYASLYEQAVRLVARVVDRLNFSDSAVQNVFTASMPKAWDPPFVGLQPLLLRGLLAADSGVHSECVQLLCKITLLPCDDVFQNNADGARLYTNMVALLPWLCLHVAEDDTTHAAFTAAERLALACEAKNLPKLAKVFSMFSKKAFSSSAGFLEELCRPLCEAFFPKFTLFTLVGLFDRLERGPADYHRPILEILAALLPCISLSEPEIRAYAPIWLGAVSRFLQPGSGSSIWPAAFRVLDVAVQRSELGGGPLEISTVRPFLPSPPQPEFSDDPRKTARVTMAIERLLRANRRTRPLNAIPPVFFSKYFSSEAEGDAAIQGIGTTISDPYATLYGGSGASGGRPLYGSGSVGSAGDDGGGRAGSGIAALAESDEEEEDDMSPRGPHPHRQPPLVPQVDTAGFGFSNHNSFYKFPSFKGFAALLEQLAGPLPPEANGDAAASASTVATGRHPTVREANLGTSGRMTIDLRGTINSDVLAATRNWRKISLKRETASENELFEVFPAASRLLKLLRDDYAAAFAEYAAAPTGEKPRQWLASNGLRPEALDRALAAAGSVSASFADQPNNVMLSIAISKYRHLVEADPSFVRTFEAQRERQMEAFNHQQSIVIEQKAAVEFARTKLKEIAIRVQTEANGADLEAVAKLKNEQKLFETQFCLAVADLHYHLLRMCSINVSLQTLLRDVLQSDQTADGDPEKSKAAIDTEIANNRAVAEAVLAKERKLLAKLETVVTDSEA